MRRLPMMFTLLFLVLSLSGCPGGGDSDPSDTRGTEGDNRGTEGDNRGTEGDNRRTEDAPADWQPADQRSSDVRLVEVDTISSDSGTPDQQDVIQDQAGGDETGGCIEVYPGQVLISEIHLNPVSVGSPQGVFIELFNAGGEALQMTDWVLEDQAGNFVDMELEAPSFDPLTYLVVGFESDTALNGGLNPGKILEPGALDLSSGGLTLKVPASSVLLDKVDWSAWELPTGASLSLDPEHMTLMDNDDPDNWCPGMEAYGAGDLGTPGAANAPCPEPDSCGNAQLDEGEDCDDGKNGDDADGCTDACAFSCHEPAEDCPDEPGDCHLPTCVEGGNGKVCGVVIGDDIPHDDNPCTIDMCFAGSPSNDPKEDGSLCSDGEDPPGDYCVDGICVPAECGDGLKGMYEPCDDGNDDPGDGCSPDCTLEECGNQVVDAGEDCDDGMNGDDGDGCRDTCLFTCTDPLQDCEDEPGNCQGAVCVPDGNGQICLVGADNGDLPDDANPCTQDLCSAGEPSHPPEIDGMGCGDGGAYCVLGQCIAPICGDQIKGPLEACDDGNEDPCDGCLANCSLHENYCGDTFVCGDEECDDGNLVSGDGCTGCVQDSVEPCPSDMVLVEANPDLGVQAFCVDRYEASRLDATPTSQGTATSIALSQPGVLPWFNNPFNEDHLATYQAACQAAGKHLCEKNEWFYACTGPEQNVYVWGDEFDEEICNCVDTFCEEYCEQFEIDPCNTASGCGYSMFYQYPEYGAPFHVAPTGQFTDCVNTQGAYDVNGNVWEIVPSDDDPNGRPYEVRGGAFNCGGPATRLMCTFNAGWSALYAGFRCCKSPVP